jgi:hypothetical protein
MNKGKLSVFSVALVTTALMIGCSSEADPPDAGSDEQPEKTAESSDALNGGVPCKATCRSAYGGRYCYYNYTITSGCHEWAVNKCHSFGLSFVDAAWSAWGCGY